MKKTLILCFLVPICIGFGILAFFALIALLAGLLESFGQVRAKEN